MDKSEKRSRSKSTKNQNNSDHVQKKSKSKERSDSKHRKVASDLDASKKLRKPPKDKEHGNSRDTSTKKRNTSFEEGAKSVSKDKVSEKRSKSKESRSGKSKSADKLETVSSKPEKNRRTNSHKNEKKRDKEKHKEQEKGQSHKLSFRETFVFENGTTTNGTLPASEQKRTAESEFDEYLISGPQETVVTENKMVNDPVEDYCEYEDDFEDYEEDFEVDDDSEEELRPISSIHKTERESGQSMDDDHGEDEPGVDADSVQSFKQESSATSVPGKATSGPSNDSRRRSVQSRIDFSRASITEAQFGAIMQSRKREKELHRLIDMDTISYELLDMVPVKDYEFYMQTFGKSNRIQVQTQTGDDNIERDMQTEDVDSIAKWTQHPPTDIHGCGSETEVLSYQNNEFRFESEIFTSLRFRQFVEKTGQLVLGILEEEADAKVMMLQKKIDTSFSEGYSIFSLGPLCKECTVTFVTFCSGYQNLIAVSFFVYKSPAEDIENHGIIGIWNLNQPDIPYRLLLCYAVPNACCFSPDNACAVFAGLDDGSVVAWDLEETESFHRRIPWLEGDIALRIPTYDTSYTSSSSSGQNTEDTVSSPIVALCSFATEKSGNEFGGSCQLACLESGCSVHIWTVLASRSSDPSELDLGLSPGGKLKLVKSAAIQPSSFALRCLSPDSPLKSSSVQAFSMVANPKKPSHFYVGTDAGFILHLYRHDDRGGPLVYQSDFEALSDVLCLAVSPFDSTLILAGSSDGSVSLYKVSESKPLVVLFVDEENNGVGQKQSHRPVTHVVWSPSSAFVFYAIHGHKVLSVWDLKRSPRRPTVTEDLSAESLVSCLEANHVGLSAELQTPCYLAVGQSCGQVQVHLLNVGGRKNATEEGQKLLRFVDCFCESGIIEAKK